jgi:acyl-CoA-binding protein
LIFFFAHSRHLTTPVLHSAVSLDVSVIPRAVEGSFAPPNIDALASILLDTVTKKRHKQVAGTIRSASSGTLRIRSPADASAAALMTTPETPVAHSPLVPDVGLDGSSLPVWFSRVVSTARPGGSDVGRVLWGLQGLNERAAAIEWLDSKLRAASTLARSKSLKKGVILLQEQGVLPRDDPDAVAAFLRLVGRAMGGEREFGDWISEEGKSEAEKKFFEHLRIGVFEGLDMRRLAFDKAVRLLLTGGGFRLPGEAQRIERIANAFSTAFFYDNPISGLDVDQTSVHRDGSLPPLPATPPRPPAEARSDGRLRLASPDLAFVLAYSIIMLNTDAHNPNIPPEKKMTLDGFVRNNRGVDTDASDKRGGQRRDLPREFLAHVYNAISTTEIRNVEQIQSMQSPGSIPSDAIAVRGTCVAGGAPSPDPLFDPCLFAGLDSDRAAIAAPVDPVLFAAALGREAAASRAQLTISQGGRFPWAPQPVHSRLSTKVLRLALRTMWPAALRVARFVCLPPADLPPHLMERLDARTDNDVTMAGLDLLKHGLTAALYLRDAEIAMEAARTLAEVDTVLGTALDVSGAVNDVVRLERRGGGKDRGEASEWYAAVHRTILSWEQTDEGDGVAPGEGEVRVNSPARGGGGSGAIRNWMNPLASVLTLPSGGYSLVSTAVASVHEAVTVLQVGAENHAEAANVAATAQRFSPPEIRAYLCADPNRRVLFEGDLVKVTKRGRGRPLRYRFVLFSDLLVYGHEVSSRGCCWGWCSRSGIRAHAVLRLRGAKLEEDHVNDAAVADRLHLPVECVIRFTTVDKPLLLVAPSTVVALLWRRHLLEALRDIAKTPLTRAPAAAKSPPSKAVASSAPPIEAVATTDKILPSSSLTVSPTSLDIAEDERSEPIMTDELVDSSTPNTEAASSSSSSSSKDLRNDFRKAESAARALLSPEGIVPTWAAGLELTDADRLKLWSLSKQAHSGDAPLEGTLESRELTRQPSGRHKLLAWKTLRGTRHRTAMQAFVAELDRLAPRWKDS